MKKISILIALSKYPSIGGRNTVVNKICNELRNLGFDITIGAFDLESELLNKPGFLKLSKIQLFKREINSQNFDIVYTHETLMNYFFFLTKSPLIFHYHGINGFLQKINLNVLSYLGINKINQIISVSNYAKNDLKKFQSKIPITVIPNGVDINLYDIELERPYVNGNPQLLFVGSILHHKNLSLLIKYMKKILKIFPDAHLQIVGSGNEESNLHLLVKKYNLEKKIEFTGKLSESELKFRYSSCDVYVSSSLLETFDLPVLEAMSCGKPFLISSIPAHEELCQKSNAGLTFSLNDVDEFIDKLELILEKKNHFTKNARSFAEKNNWVLICKKIGELHKSLL